MLDWTEDQRLAALAEHDLLDTPAEEVFDALAKAAARACGVPFAAVTLLSEQKQWFKAKVGLKLDETPREDAFCNYTIRHADGVMVVPDATADARFAENPLVTGGPSLRFYAGAPIQTEDGLPLGALCVLDDRARPLGLTSEQRFLLQTLADQVSEQIKLRRAMFEQRLLSRRQAEELRAGVAREARLARALETGGVGWWEWDVPGNRVSANAELAADFGLDPEIAETGLPLARFVEAVDPQDRPMLQEAIAEAVRTGEPFREEYRLLGSDGQVRWVSARGRCLHDQADGRATCFPGILIDITARKDAEARLREADIGREMALRAARLGRWDHRPAAGERYLDARAMELFSLRPGEDQQSDATLQHVHPEDRPGLAEAVAAAVDPNRTGPYRQVFRVVDPDSAATRWLSAFGTSQFENGVCTRFLGVVADITAEQLAAEHRALLTGELNHRVKNTMALVMSLVMSSLRGVGDAALRKTVQDRLVGLGRAHDMLTAENWSAAAAPAIVDSLIETLSLPRDRLDLSGPPLKLGPKAALHLALALHELATNALKYGALSSDTGRVRVAWGLEMRAGVKTFYFDWKERDGPAVAAPTRTGFGSRLIQRATAAEFGGETTLDYAPDGVAWRLTAPFEGLAELGRLTFEDASGGPAQPASAA